MKKRLNLSLLLFVGFCFSTEAQTYRVLALGNSLTQGWGIPPVSERVGYRLQVYNSLVDSGYAIDMVGHRIAGEDIHPDPDHAGTPNFRDQHVVRLLQDGYDELNNTQITPNNNPYLDIYSADIILLHIGTNDILNGEGSDVDMVSSILDEIDIWKASNNETVNVFVAKIVNTFPARKEITTFNNKLETMVVGRNDPRIILVDMENGAGIEYSSIDFEDDGIHLSQTGYVKMGTAWSSAVESFLSAPPVAPGDLHLTEVNSRSIRVNWTDNSFDESGFEIHRSLTVESAFSLIHTTGYNIEHYIDNSVSSGETYYYKVRSVNDNGFSSFTNTEGVTTPDDDLGNHQIGNGEIYSSTTFSANRRAMSVTFPENGKVESISMYHNGGTGNMLMGVYAAASGVPGSRIAVTPGITVSSSAGWQTVELISPVEVSAGQTAWLAWVFEDNPGIRFAAGMPARAESIDTWSGGMPLSFGASSMDNYKYSLYCSYSPNGFSDQLKDRFKVYPTPTSNRIKILWNWNYETGLVLTMLNTSGEKVYTTIIEPGQKEIHLELNEYNAGLYLIIISNPLEEKIIHKVKIVLTP